MLHDAWTAVDAWLSDQLALTDAALEAALAASDAAGLPPINVSPSQGKLLHLLARSIGARTILEVGTLGGYSAIWLARALPPDGRLTTLEIDPRNAEIARQNIANAGFSEHVEIRVGPALESLAQLQAEHVGPVDFTFIDADKLNNVGYFEAALTLSRPGGLIIVDNIIRNGHLIDAASDDPSIQGSRRLVEYVASEPRVSATAIQTVSGKGYDGFLLARVKD